MKFPVSGRALLTALVVVVAAMAGGIAYASIPDSAGVIHGCYSAKEASSPNGTQLNIIDGGSASCRKSQQEITWSQTGPRGPAGKDGVSVTSTPIVLGDVHCPLGGSQFTAAGGNVTYICNGANGAKGDKGDTGPAGSSTTYTNYGDGTHFLAPGDTQTVASLTLPAGTYTLSATADVSKFSAVDQAHVQCSFLSAGTVNGNVALASLEEIFHVRLPLIGDVTITANNTSVLLRCAALFPGPPAEASGDMIATQVGTITPSK